MSGGPAIDEASVTRGYPHRYTDFMEQLQIGHLNAVAAASGVILGQFTIDDGVDVIAKHWSERHTTPPDKTARLEIQLKATSAFVGDDRDFVSVQMRRDRWEYFRAQNVTLGKIIVIMSMPAAQERWTSANPDYFSIRHCAYWVNATTLPDSSADKPTVVAPKQQVFDDVALCRMMERIGRGEAP